MKHLYIQRKGDLEKVKENLEYFKLKTNQELIDSYNDSVKIGIVGAHAQGLHLLAMRAEFIKRFNRSPVILEDDIIISLSGKIKRKDNDYTEQIKMTLLLNDDTTYDVYTESIIDLDAEFIDVRSLNKENNEALLFRVSHHHSLTQLNLTDVSPYVILFFDEKLEFIGASYSIKSSEGSFSIKTQYQTILLIRMPNNLKLNNIISLNI